MTALHWLVSKTKNLRFGAFFYRLLETSVYVVILGVVAKLFHIAPETAILEMLVIYFGVKLATDKR